VQFGFKPVLLPKHSTEISVRTLLTGLHTSGLAPRACRFSELTDTCQARYFQQVETEQCETEHSHASGSLKLDKDYRKIASLFCVTSLICMRERYTQYGIYIPQGFKVNADVFSGQLPLPETHSCRTSGRDRSLLTHPPLRTVHATFTAHGSSLHLVKI
jgi:hypothetical protein